MKTIALALLATSNVSHSAHKVSIPVTEEKNFRSKPLIFSAAAIIARGEQVLSVAVVDQVSRAAGFARATINAQ